MEAAFEILIAPDVVYFLVHKHNLKYISWVGEENDNLSNVADLK